MNTQKLKRIIRKILIEYFLVVDKLYGTPLKAFLNFVMVAGFYIVSDVAIMSLGSVAYNIYHVPVSQLHLFLFNSIIFPIVTWVITFQFISITLGFLFWLGGHEKRRRR